MNNPLGKTILILACINSAIASDDQHRRAPATSAIAKEATTKTDKNADRLVRIFFNENGRRWVTGDVVPANLLNTILFIKEPCSLDVEDGENMLRAWGNYAVYQVGCWYPTTDSQYVFVGQLAGQTHKSGAYWEAHPHALLHADGTATITEPNYDSTTFMREVSDRKSMEVFKHLRERP